MSDLQIVLIILGAIIIAGVVVYNWLQERKMRENITEDFIVPQKDVLTEDFYVDADALVDEEFKDDARKTEIVSKLNDDASESEPVVTSNNEGAALEPEVDSNPLSVSDRIEPDITSIAADEAPEEVTLSAEALEAKAIAKDAMESDIEAHKDIVPAELEPSAAIPSLPEEVHSQIDLTAFLYGPKGMNKQALQNLTKDTLKDLETPVQVHGLDDDGQWHNVNKHSDEDFSYKQAALSIQLADRRGPVPSPILNKFQFAAETIGLELNAHVEWQNNADASQRAIDLDEFCMDVDQLVSVHLVHGDTPIHGTKFKGLAEANEMKLKQGKYCSYGEASKDYPQFVLINADDQAFTEEGLSNSVIINATFQMEVPKASNCDQVFSDMVSTAQKMANSLGARIVDDNQKPLGDLQIEKIRQQLKVIHATMVARSIMPGSASSMRLFN